MLSPSSPIKWYASNKVVLRNQNFGFKFLKDVEEAIGLEEVVAKVWSLLLQLSKTWSLCNKCRSNSNKKGKVNCAEVGEDEELTLLLTCIGDYFYILLPNLP